MCWLYSYSLPKSQSKSGLAQEFRHLFPNERQKPVYLRGFLKLKNDRGKIAVKAINWRDFQRISLISKKIARSDPVPYLEKSYIALNFADGGDELIGGYGRSAELAHNNAGRDIGEHGCSQYRKPRNQT